MRGDGGLRTHAEWPRERTGGTPDALVDAMSRVGFGPGDEEDDPGTPDGRP
ncbi:hypothetical protein GCM10010420_36360 [Streptomyces glaucosporus]|uniref:Uncharacterized protein n=1 Tax=Streptomyces glaucosporus TaxID=284044 RepID=A0ABP5VK32_9ACTN